MSRVFSNGPNNDYVSSAFSQLLKDATFAHLASPIFADAKKLVSDLILAAKKGKRIRLLVGLNQATSPSALRRIHEESDISIRYLTRQFHAKVYIFDKAVLLGSANLTLGGLRENREAVVQLDTGDDTQAVDEARSLFAELWESGQVLTRAKLAAFEKTHNEFRPIRSTTPALAQTIEAEFDKVDSEIEKVRPSSFKYKRRIRERMFLESLRQEIYDRFRPAFREVTEVLKEQDVRRPELTGLGIEIETSRFLNYTLLTHALRIDVRQNVKSVNPKSTVARRELIVRYAREWGSASDIMIPANYMVWIQTVKQTFGTRKAIETADQKMIVEGLMSLHAFRAQTRFVGGGSKNVSSQFWRMNNNDLDLVKETLVYLVHGPGEFVQRLHDVLYDKSKKVRFFGKYSALELCGTIRPDECPPINRRMVRALTFLGFHVEGK